MIFVSWLLRERHLSNVLGLRITTSGVWAGRLGYRKHMKLRKVFWWFEDMVSARQWFVIS